MRSLMTGRDFIMKSFGLHVLTFDGFGPYDSENIRWDGKPITVDQLIALVKFDIDPDTLKPMDWRSHHRKNGRHQDQLSLA